MKRLNFYNAMLMIHFNQNTGNIGGGNSSVNENLSNNTDLDKPEFDLPAGTYDLAALVAHATTVAGYTGGKTKVAGFHIEDISTNASGAPFTVATVADGTTNGTTFMTPVQYRDGGNDPFGIERADAGGDVVEMDNVQIVVATGSIARVRLTVF